MTEDIWLSCGGDLELYKHRYWSERRVMTGARLNQMLKSSDTAFIDAGYCLDRIEINCCNPE